MRVGAGSVYLGSATRRRDGSMKFVQKRRTLCAAEPKSAASMITGAPMNDYTKCPALITSVVHLSPV